MSQLHPESSLEAWWSRITQALKVLPQIQSDVKAIRVDLERQDKKIDDLVQKVANVAVSTDKLQQDVQALVDGGKAKDLLIAKLQEELASADSDAQARVDAAVAAEDADAQSKIDAADAVADGYLNPPAPDNGGGGDDPAPVDDGS